MKQTFTTPQQALKSVFGYDHFRLDQEAIINRTLSGKDSLVIMPTGGGKSVCFQIPALLKEGVALVISPLIALMKDQVEALRANGVNAAALNSSLTDVEEREIVADIMSGELKLLYVSPEKAVSSQFMHFIGQQKLSLIAIDEAHCVSVWGNDFRPEYTQLYKLVNGFPEVPHIALTATADKATQSDISKQLQLKNSQKFLSSFERNNLSIKVLPAQDRYGHIKRFIKNRDGAGIIYCLSRKNTMDVANKLKADGYDAGFYHAGMGPKERSRVQEAFLRDEKKIICATIAFGMGIDKSNIRWVIHYSMPKNLESYYQEIGRAGRDGLPSDTLIFQGFGDYQTLRSFVTDSNADETFKEVQLAKLNRMLDYVQATSCRTNLILNYFGEFREKGCGRCDICLNPPQAFDGTVLSQKALSALKRLPEGVTISTLVDVLRGSAKSEIMSKGFQNIKTYGAGKDIGYVEWIQYVTQMINQGIVEVDYVNKHHLVVTPKGEGVLFKQKKVKLTQALTPQERKEQAKEKPKSKTAIFEEELYENLRKKRLELAKDEGVPPYVVFSDKTLKEMATERPINVDEMGEISGVGAVKLDKYGQTFIEVIEDFISENSKEVRLKGSTYIETKRLLSEGNSPEEIGQIRNLSPTTVYSHIAHLYVKNEPIDIYKYISQTEINEIAKAWEKIGRNDSLKPLFEFFKGEMEYYKLRLALSVIKKER